MRTYAVTGSASGIGAGLTKQLRAQGHQVISIDRADADVAADLSTRSGVNRMAAEVARRSGGSLDGVAAVAGVGASTLPPRDILAINFAGARDTLEALRPQLARGTRPGAAVVSSIAALSAQVDEVVRLCLNDDLDAAAAACDGSGAIAYSASKRAIAQWVRGRAALDEWAGDGISLNAVGPGMTSTPMTEYFLSSEDAVLDALVRNPQPLCGIGRVEDIASLLAWLTSENNGFVTGQVIFADGGHDAVVTKGFLAKRSDGSNFVGGRTSATAKW